MCNKSLEMHEPDKCSKCGNEELEVYEPPMFETDNRVSAVLYCPQCGHRILEYFDLSEIFEKDTP